LTQEGELLPQVQGREGARTNRLAFGLPMFSNQFLSQDPVGGGGISRGGKRYSNLGYQGEQEIGEKEDSLQTKESRTINPQVKISTDLPGGEMATVVGWVASEKILGRGYPKKVLVPGTL